MMTLPTVYVEWKEDWADQPFVMFTHDGEAIGEVPYKVGTYALVRVEDGKAVDPESLRGLLPAERDALPHIRSGNLIEWAGLLSTWDELAHLHPEAVLERLEAAADILAEDGSSDSGTAVPMSDADASDMDAS